jgi:hypothetical protein
VTARTGKRAAPGAAPRAARSFYAGAVENAEALVEAAELTGLDEEVALLRVRLRELMEEKETDYALMLKGMELLVRAVATKYRMSPQSADELGRVLGEVITRVGDQLFPPEREV